ncbi:MAG TPA: PH domain-containing protein [Alphaproteobacteria bacterium]|nr:PH domain-containing protein [Alphaproteobacteria bacterium]HNS44382.1 PH domain-containing protein [Alphaproteobacteria bacterium]
MSFIAKHISGNDERIVYIARIHWIYVLQGFLWFVLLSIGGIILNFGLWYGLYQLSSVVRVPFLIPESLSKEYALFFMMLTVGVMVLWIHILKFLGTEIALTSHRVIYKVGFFFVTVEELDLAEIKEERVHHGILGALLNYGEIHLDSRFVGDVTLPAIRNPYKLLKYINKVRIGMPHDGLPPPLPDHTPFP